MCGMGTAINVSLLHINKPFALHKTILDLTLNLIGCVSISSLNVCFFVHFFYIPLYTRILGTSLCRREYRRKFNSVSVYMGLRREDQNLEQERKRKDGVIVLQEVSLCRRRETTIRPVANLRLKKYVNNYYIHTGFHYLITSFNSSIISNVFSESQLAVHLYETIQQL